MKTAVALCGTMWHYVALSKKQKNVKIINFDENSCGTMWHYVALCGTIKKAKKHKKTRNLMKTVVALCGTMWHYVALSKKQKKHKKHKI